MNKSRLSFTKTFLSSWILELLVVPVVSPSAVNDSAVASPWWHWRYLLFFSGSLTDRVCQGRGWLKIWKELIRFLAFFRFPQNGRFSFYFPPSQFSIPCIFSIPSSTLPVRKIDVCCQLGDLNLHQWKLTDKIAGVDIAGLEIEELKIAGLDSRRSSNRIQEVLQFLVVQIQLSPSTHCV